MYRIFSWFFILLFYLEGVYHVAAYGSSTFNPMFMIPGILMIAAVETGLAGLWKKKACNGAIASVLVVLDFLFYAVQIVYFKIFTRPLMLETAIATGGDALTDFSSVARDGILRSAKPLAVMAVPLIVWCILLGRKFFKLKKYRLRFFLEVLLIGVTGVMLTLALFVFGYRTEQEYYEVFQEMYAPEMIAKEYGVLPLFERQLLGDLLVEIKEKRVEWVDDFEEPPEMTEKNPENLVDMSPNILDVDLDALIQGENEEIADLAELMKSMTPSKKNQYTGMFDGYNLIYITAEGFSQYAVSEELTPTLYKMMNHGIVVKDYYVPLWQTSTSDGEYVNLFGQIPDGQHSFRRSARNTYPYALPAYFKSQGVKSYAYHNNSLSYYDRYLTHPNLGYDFKAARLGSCSAEEWGDKLFEITNAWPASDYEMMEATIPEWIGEERFHAYYMTVSGHAIYTWEGNSMSSKNKEAVASLDCSEEMKAYIACNLELEKAMTYLIEQLEAAGKLDSTVIVLSADHYPYGLTDAKAEMEAMSNKKLSDLDVQRNCLIMYNSAMDTIEVEKTCSAMDIMPTLLNLFGFEYDSRLFAGRDMLSDSPSLVVFSNRSFITDSVIYDASTKKAISRTEDAVSEEYLEGMKSYVKSLFRYSAGILNEGFHEAVSRVQLKK